MAMRIRLVPLISLSGSLTKPSPISSTPILLVNKLTFGVPMERAAGLVKPAAVRVKGGVPKVSVGVSATLGGILKSKVIALAVGTPNKPKLTPTAHANTRVRILIFMTRSHFALLRPARCRYVTAAPRYGCATDAML